jgi:hypothetical protein
MISAMREPSGPPVSPALFDRLRQVARARGTVFYSELAAIVGIDTENPHFGALVGRILDEVNRIEFREGRPMLSAIVILKDGNMPGRGFFECARELRRYSGKGDLDDLGFWVEELRRVHDYWSRH